MHIFAILIWSLGPLTCTKISNVLVPVCACALLLTVLPVKVTGGDCQEMLKVEPLVGVKVLAEPLLLLLEGMDTGAVAWGRGGQERGQRSVSLERKRYAVHI